MSQAKINYRVVEENNFFVGKYGDKSITSPLLECGGLFIYSPAQAAGVLAHWQDSTREKDLRETLSQLRLDNACAVIAGCGLPVECLDTKDSRTYQEIRKFLDSEKIKIRHARVGLDRAVTLHVDFSNGSYRIRRARCL